MSSICYLRYMKLAWYILSLFHVCILQANNPLFFLYSFATLFKPRYLRSQMPPSLYSVFDMIRVVWSEILLFLVRGDLQATPREIHQTHFQFSFYFTRKTLFFKIFRYVIFTSWVPIKIDQQIQQKQKKSVMSLFWMDILLLINCRTRRIRCS